MEGYLIGVAPPVKRDDLLLADAGLADGADLAVGPRLQPLVEAGPAEEVAAQRYDGVPGHVQADVALELRLGLVVVVVLLVVIVGCGGCRGGLRLGRCPGRTLLLIGAEVGGGGGGGSRRSANFFRGHFLSVRHGTIFCGLGIFLPKG